MLVIRQHFGLTRLPFLRADCRSPFRSTDLAAVAATLDRLRLTGGLGLCCGEAGAGKSTAVGAWAEAQNSNEVTIRWLDDPGASVSAFLRRSLRALGIAPAWGVDNAWQQLTDGIVEHYRETRRHLIFIVDEAQHLSPAILEQLRRLTNLGRQEPLPLSYVLIAHREFLAPLSQQHLTAFRRRLRVAATLGGLTAGETAPYVEHHLAQAGAARPIFGDDALELLWSASRGLPRVLDTLALAALDIAATGGRTLVEASTLQQVIAAQEVMP